MPVADSLVSRFQGGDNYGLIEKGFWSREARKKNAAEAYAAAAAAQEVGDQTRSSNEAQITKERDERLHGQDMTRMAASYAKQLANRMEELGATGALAIGEQTKNQAELDAVGHEDRLKMQPTIVQNQLSTKLGQTMAERIRAQKFADQTGALTDAELEAQMAKLKEGKTVAEYGAADPGRKDKLTAAEMLLRAQMAKDIESSRSATDRYEADRMADKGGSTKIPITSVESTPGSGKIDLKKLKGVGGSQPAPASGQFAPAQLDGVEQAIGYINQLLRGFAAPK